MSKSRPRVLLVDDEAAIRMTVRRGLEAFGYDVESGSDGVEGVRLVESWRPDVVLLDVRPRLEYESGHIPGALTIPIAELGDRLGELPSGKKVVVYCRGSYCQFADEAVALLTSHGFAALRLEGGWSEWSAEQPRP